MPAQISAMRSYTITIRTPAGQLSVRRHTPRGAIRKARELAAKSPLPVTITDPDGRSLELSDFVARVEAQESG